jgi:hypothetical protein
MKIDFEFLKQIPNDPESTCFACGKKNPLGFQLVFIPMRKKSIRNISSVPNSVGGVTWHMEEF